MKHWRVRHRLVFEVTVSAMNEAEAMRTAKLVEAASGYIWQTPTGAPVQMINGGYSATLMDPEGQVVIRKEEGGSK